MSWNEEHLRERKESQKAIFYLKKKKMHNLPCPPQNQFSMSEFSEHHHHVIKVAYDKFT